MSSTISNKKKFPSIFLKAFSYFQRQFSLSKPKIHFDSTEFLTKSKMKLLNIDCSGVGDTKHVWGFILKIETKKENSSHQTRNEQKNRNKIFAKKKNVSLLFVSNSFPHVTRTECSAKLQQCHDAKHEHSPRNRQDKNKKISFVRHLSEANVDR